MVYAVKKNINRWLGCVQLLFIPQACIVDVYVAITKTNVILVFLVLVFVRKQVDDWAVWNNLFVIQACSFDVWVADNTP